ncbi:MAG: glycosyltransferase family 2 protein [Acidobacteriota bacterium]
MRYLTAIIFILWVLAFFRTLLNLALVPRLKRGAMPSARPLVSIIIPAREEAHVIGRTVRALLASTYDNFELIVIDDRSTDGTGDVVRAIDDPRLLVIAGEEPPAGWLGKPWALHKGSLVARGELLLFVDADILYAPGALAAAVAWMEETGRDMITLLPDIRMRGFWDHVAMPNLAMFLFTLSPSWLANRTNLPMLAIGGGTGNLVRRDAYAAAGGHEALKAAVVDDVALGRLIRRSGRTTAGVRAEQFVSVHMYDGLRGIVEGFTKNGFAIFNRNYALAVVVLAISAAGNLLPYALAVTGEPFSIASVALITVIRVILFAALGYSLLAAIFLHPLMIAVWLWIMLRSMWITGIRRRLPWRGRVYDARETRFGEERK